MSKEISKNKREISGEAALATAVVINSFGVILMLYSGAGISAISSVPYAFSLVLPQLSLGMWTYIFQGILILTLMVLRKRFVFEYLCSFLVGFAFSAGLDLHRMWINILPINMPLRIIYFIISFIIISIGIGLSNRCGLPIVPTDLFARELSSITGIRYPRIKIPFDVLCLITTAILTGVFLSHIEGLSYGTVFAAFFMGKAIGIFTDFLDKHFDIHPFFIKGRRKTNV